MIKNKFPNSYNINIINDSNDADIEDNNNDDIEETNNPIANPYFSQYQLLMATNNWPAALKSNDAVTLLTELFKNIDMINATKIIMHNMNRQTFSSVSNIADTKILYFLKACSTQKLRQWKCLVTLLTKDNNKNKKPHSEQWQSIIDHIFSNIKKNKNDKFKYLTKKIAKEANSLPLFNNNKRHHSL